jgi:hypothetical protein
MLGKQKKPSISALPKAGAQRKRSAMERQHHGPSVIKKAAVRSSDHAMLAFNTEA